MVIWVISDTHLTKSQVLPDSFTDKIGREDIILHLGDLVSFEIIEYLQSLCHVHAVRGNCDLPDVRRVLPPKSVLELNGLKLGLMHGQGGHDETLRLIKAEYQGKVDIALFGHTHIPFHHRDNGTLFFNPGSLTNNRDGKNSYGILHIDDQPWGEIIEL
jgi:uncharacterized protein